MSVERVFDDDTSTEESSVTDPHEVKQQGTDPSTTSSAEKDNANWVTGDEPMTGPQASYLETLAHQAGEEPPTGLTKAQASDEIERLQGSVTPPAATATATAGTGASPTSRARSAPPPTGSPATSP